VANLTVSVPSALVEAIAERAAELVLERIAAESSSPRLPDLMTPAEAATYMRCARQRIYDLLSAGRLSRRKDGSRVLVSRAEIDAYLGSGHRNRVAPALPRRAECGTGSAVAV
jgi:excisionase family DNA binding protein